MQDLPLTGLKVVKKQGVVNYEGSSYQLRMLRTALPDSRFGS